MTKLADEEIEEIRMAIARKMTDDDKDPQAVIDDDYGGDTDAYFRVMAGWHNIPIGVDRALKNIIFILSDFSSYTITKPIIYYATKNLDAQEILELIAKLRQLIKDIEEKGKEEMARLDNWLLYIRRMKGEMFCFLEEKKYQDDKHTIEEAVKSKSLAISQIIALLKE
jgi:hypothetical protein